MLADAAAQGAEFILTPEVTNCISTSREHQNDVLQLRQMIQRLRPCGRMRLIWASGF